MTALATDDFNRADSGDLGANWTPVDSTFSIVSNTAQPVAFGSDASERYTGIAWPDDQYVQAAVSGIAGTGGGAGIGLMLRGSGVVGPSMNFYRIILNAAGANNLTVDKFVAGVNGPVTTRTQAFSNGDVLKAQISGTTLKLFKNGVQIGADITDSDIATGSPGVSYSSTITSGALNLWEGGDLTSPVDTGLAWIRA